MRKLHYTQATTTTTKTIRKELANEFVSVCLCLYFVWWLHNSIKGARKCELDTAILLQTCSLSQCFQWICCCWRCVSAANSIPCVPLIVTPFTRSLKPWMASISMSLMSASQMKSHSAAAAVAAYDFELLPTKSFSIASVCKSGCVPAMCVCVCGNCIKQWLCEMCHWNGCLGKMVQQESAHPHKSYKTT